MLGLKLVLDNVRGPKKHALNLNGGDLLEHYARLWSYIEEIRISNSNSIIKIDVNYVRLNTFAPVAKLITVRILLTMAVKNN